MKFCHVTTFFGSSSFGGDAAYVDRLTRALLRQGHSVDVVYCGASFDALRGSVAPRAYRPPVGLTQHILPSPGGMLSLLYTHQTGRMGFRRALLQQILDRGAYDVVHYHNVSLIGGAEILSLRPATAGSLTLMTAHEYWLVCPLSLLWKFGAEPCHEPQCASCTLRASRPPQFWRRTTHIGNHSLAGLDAILFPSRHALERHTARGISHPRLIQLPYFLPADWAGASGIDAPQSERPYFAAAGRLVPEKGFQSLFPLMRSFPNIDLHVAGDGPFAAELHLLAANAPNIKFCGPLDAPELARFFRGAVAVIVPSLFEETFGYVVAEALSTGTPVVVHRRGALPEVLQCAGDVGLSYDSPESLRAAMATLLEDPDRRREMGRRGLAAVERRWSESAHLDAYFGILDQCRAGH